MAKRWQCAINSRNTSYPDMHENILISTLTELFHYFIDSSVPTPTFLVVLLPLGVAFVQRSQYKVVDRLAEINAQSRAYDHNLEPNRSPSRPELNLHRGKGFRWLAPSCMSLQGQEKRVSSLCLGGFRPRRHRPISPEAEVDSCRSERPRVAVRRSLEFPP